MTFPPRLFAAFSDDLLELDAGGRPTTLVAADDDERIVGTMRLYPAGGASALLAECERPSAAGGATAISRHSTAFMAATHRLATRHGFRRVPAWDLDGGVHFGLDAEDLRVLAYAKDIR